MKNLSSHHYVASSQCTEGFIESERFGFPKAKKQYCPLIHLEDHNIQLSMAYDRFF